jgi:Fic family protein
MLLNYEGQTERDNDDDDDTDADNELLMPSTIYEHMNTLSTPFVLLFSRNVHQILYFLIGFTENGAFVIEDECMTEARSDGSLHQQHPHHTRT